MSNPADRIREIEERTAKATPGPWKCGEVEGTIPLGIPLGCPHGTEILHAYSADNAEFIAHARQDVPWLLNLVRELQSELRKILRRSTDAGAAEILDELLRPKSCNKQTQNESEKNDE